MTKPCSVCGKDYPATSEYFSPRPRNADKLSRACRSCIRYRHHLNFKDFTGQALCGNCGAGLKDKPLTGMFLCPDCMPKRGGRAHQDICYTCHFVLLCRERVIMYQPVLCERADLGDTYRAKIYEEMSAL